MCLVSASFLGKVLEHRSQLYPCEPSCVALCRVKCSALVKDLSHSTQVNRCFVSSAITLLSPRVRSCRVLSDAAIQDLEAVQPLQRDRAICQKLDRLTDALWRTLLVVAHSSIPSSQLIDQSKKTHMRAFLSSLHLESHTTLHLVS